MQYPQRCAVAKCQVPPVQIERYAINADGTGENEVAVCGYHSGHAAHKWRLASITPITGRIGYTLPATDMEATV